MNLGAPLLAAWLLVACTQVTEGASDPVDGSDGIAASDAVGALDGLAGETFVPDAAVPIDSGPTGDALTDTQHADASDDGPADVPGDVTKAETSDADPGDTPDSAPDTLADAAPDTAPDLPSDLGPTTITPTVDDQLEPIRRPLLPAPVGSVAALSDGRGVAATDTGLVLIDPDGTSAPIASPSAAEVWSAGLVSDPAALLVATDVGLLVDVDDRLEVSPLGGVVGADVVDLVSTDEGVWLATADGLHLWSEGFVAEVLPEGLPTHGARLAHGPAVGGVPAVWVGSGSTAYALIPDGDGGHISSVGLEDLASVDALVSDARGQLWVLAPGTLWRRDAQESWAMIDLGAEPVAVTARADGFGVWLRTSETVIFHDAGRWSAPAVPISGMDALVARAGAGAYAVVAGALERVDSQRVVRFEGLSEGTTIQIPVHVTVVADEPQVVETLEVTLDDQPVTLDDGSWGFTVDAAALALGFHQLNASVVYADGPTPTTATVGFLVAAPPTWTVDITPLYLARCDGCHNPTAIDEPRWLHTVDRWRERIDEIVDRVEVGNMPADGTLLSEGDVEVIRTWRAAGMPE